MNQSLQLIQHEMTPKPIKTNNKNELYKHNPHDLSPMKITNQRRTQKSWEKIDINQKGKKNNRNVNHSIRATAEEDHCVCDVTKTTNKQKKNLLVNNGIAMNEQKVNNNKKMQKKIDLTKKK